MLAQLEGSYPLVSPQDCPAAEAILVLGGIIGPKGGNAAIPAQWNDAVDRFEAAIELYRLGKAPVLLFTSSGNDGIVDSFNEGEQLRQAAISHGVPAQSIRLTPPAHNTATEASAVKQAGYTRVILVTSASHMPRAVFLFRRAGIDALPYPTDYRATLTWDATQFFPTAEAMSLTEIALREIYGNLLYRLFP